MNKNKIVLAMLLACGSAHAASPRIVGGDEVSTAPSWMASLQARNSLTGVTYGHICGATLISPEWMMTAAHCVDGAGTAERTLLIGRSSSAVDEKSEVAIDQIIIHPGWGGIIDGTTSDLTDFQDDIALLHLAASQSADPVTRATSAQQESLTTYQDVTAIGWGATNGAGTLYPEQLQQVTLPYQGKAYSSYLPNHLFAGGFNGEGICFGDSGGPLLIGNTQYGISSMVLGTSDFTTLLCGDDSTLGGFTAVADYSDWINDKLQGLNYGNYQHILLTSGSTSQASFVIRNLDDVTWSISNVAADVTLDDQCSGQSLAPGASCTLIASYTGSSLGTVSRSITFTATAGDSTVQGSMQLDAETVHVQVEDDMSDGDGGGSAGWLALAGLGLLGWRRRR
ncbi:S1 family peptidase [Pseudaeromonas sharmana]|uniref:S1 family peptidase n=1 Tax=Pseudaeromonas sharmana TaxID=328412 RepID=A0ABV8CIG9_9GAMM